MPAITSFVRSPRFRRVLGGLVVAFLVITGFTWLILSLTWPDVRVIIHVRWKPDVTDAQRVELERRFQLVDAEHSEGTTWRYRLLDLSTANIRTLVDDERVDDTAHVNRIRYRPEFGMDRSRQIFVYSVAIGAVVSVLLLAMTAVRFSS